MPLRQLVNLCINLKEVLETMLFSMHFIIPTGQIFMTVQLLYYITCGKFSSFWTGQQNINDFRNDFIHLQHPPAGL